MSASKTGTVLLDLKGLSLLVILCLAIFVEKKITIVTWVSLTLFCFYCNFKWRQAIILIFIWLTVEGFLRLWSGGDIIIFFFKDAMLMMVYLGFLMEKMFFREKIFSSNPINLPLLCLLTLSVIQMLNPNIYSIVVGLVGLKTLFFYVPLFYIAYNLFDSNDAVYRFCLALIVIAIPVCLYGVIQFIQGPFTYRSLGKAFSPWLVGVSPTGMAFIPPSTFIFVAVFGAYLLFMAFLGISMLNFKSQPPINKGICYLSFTLIFAALVVTTRRATWAVLMIEFPLIFLLQKRVSTFWKIIILSSLIIAGSLYLIPGAIAPFFYRLADIVVRPIDLVYHERATAVWEAHLPSIISASFIGKGIGMGSLGKRYVWSEEAPTVPMECQYAKIWYELSVWGFIIFVWLLARLLRNSWRVYRNLDDLDLRWLALGIFMHQIALVIIGGITNVLDVPLNAIYLWFFLGLLLKLPSLAVEQSQPQEGNGR